MKILSRHDLRNHVRRKEISPVYLLFGEEGYLRNIAARAISDLVLKDAASRSFNESEYSLLSTDLREALSAAEQLPLMAEKRVVRVTDVTVSANNRTCTLGNDQAEDLDRYLSDPASTTVLIFIADEIDGRMKISRLLTGKTTAVRFDRLKEEEVKIRVRGKLRKLNVHAEEKAIDQVVSLIGPDVRKLDLELEKLAVAAHPKDHIDYALVESLVPVSRELTNFALTNQLLSNNRVRALQTLQELLDDGAEPLMLLGLIASNFRQLLLVKEMMNEGAGEREVAATVRMPYKVKRDFLSTARRSDRGRLMEILRKLAVADKAIKTSRATPRLQIEMLVCEIAALG